MGAVHSLKHGSCVLGTIGDHDDSPIECLALSPDGGLVASAAHGEPSVRLWSTDLAHKLLLGEQEKEEGATAGDGDEEADSDDSDEQPKKKKLKGKKGKKGQMKAGA